MSGGCRRLSSSRYERRTSISSGQRALNCCVLRSSLDVSATPPGGKKIGHSKVGSVNASGEFGPSLRRGLPTISPFLMHTSAVFRRKLMNPKNCRSAESSLALHKLKIHQSSFKSIMKKIISQQFRLDYEFIDAAFGPQD